MRVLVANDPRAYREVLQRTFLALRPHLQVTLADPAELDQTIARLRPHLVICSELSPAVQGVPITWIMLYPQGGEPTLVSIASERTTAVDLAFDQLLTIVDATERRLAADGDHGIPQMR